MRGQVRPANPAQAMRSRIRQTILALAFVAGQVGANAIGPVDAGSLNLERDADSKMVQVARKSWGDPGNPVRTRGLRVHKPDKTPKSSPSNPDDSKGQGQSPSTTENAPGAATQKSE
jgi:hypothetical protein